MPTRVAASLAVVVGLSLAGVAAAPLPAGNSGIAARYPSDAGIAADPAVIFADDFESYVSAAALTNKWSETYHSANTRIATEPANVYNGAHSLEFTIPPTTSELSNTVAKVVSPGQDTLFLRYYARYGAGFNVIGFQPQRQYHLGQVLLPRRSRGRLQQVSRQLRSLARQHGDGESRPAQHVRLPSRAARHLGGPLLPHRRGSAEHEPAVRFRSRVRFPSGCHTPA